MIKDKISYFLHKLRFETKKRLISKLLIIIYKRSSIKLIKNFILKTIYIFLAYFQAF